MDYEFLRQALSEAIEERKLNPRSSRIAAVIDLVLKNQKEAQAHLDAANEQAKVVGGPDFVQQVNAARRRWTAALAELAVILKAAGEAESKLAAD